MFFGFIVCLRSFRVTNWSNDQGYIRKSLPKYHSFIPSSHIRSFPTHCHATSIHLRRFIRIWIPIGYVDRIVSWSSLFVVRVFTLYIWWRKCRNANDDDAFIFAVQLMDETILRTPRLPLLRRIHLLISMRTAGDVSPWNHYFNTSAFQLYTLHLRRCIFIFLIHCPSRATPRKDRAWSWIPNIRSGGSNCCARKGRPSSPSRALYHSRSSLRYLLRQCFSPPSSYYTGRAFSRIFVDVCGRTTSNLTWAMRLLLIE